MEGTPRSLLLDGDGDPSVEEPTRAKQKSDELGVGNETFNPKKLKNYRPQAAHGPLPCMAVRDDQSSGAALERTSQDSLGNHGTASSSRDGQMSTDATSVTQIGPSCSIINDMSDTQDSSCINQPLGNVLSRLGSANSDPGDHIDGDEVPPPRYGPINFKTSIRFNQYLEAARQQEAQRNKGKTKSEALNRRKLAMHTAEAIKVANAIDTARAKPLPPHTTPTSVQQDRNSCILEPSGNKNRGIKGTPGTLGEQLPSSSSCSHPQGVPLNTNPINDFAHADRACQQLNQGTQSCDPPPLQQPPKRNANTLIHEVAPAAKRAKPRFNRSHFPDARQRGSVSGRTDNPNQDRKPSEPLPEQLPRHGFPVLTQVQGAGTTMRHLPVASSNSGSSGAGVTCTAPSGPLG